MKKLNLLLLLFFVTNLLYSQKNSFLRTYEGFNPAHQLYYDTENQARDNFWTAPDSTVYYAKKCYDIAVRDNNIYGKIVAKNVMGFGYYLNGSNPEAVESFLSAFKMLEPLNKSKLKTFCLSESNDGLGCTYCQAGIFEQGFPYLYKAKDIAYSLRDSVGILNEVQSIGVYYEQSNQIDSAELYLMKSLSLESEYKNNAYHSMIRTSLGNCKIKNNQIADAVIYWKDALSSKRIDKVSGSQAHTGLGKYYLDKGNYDSSYFHLKKAIEWATVTANIQNLYKANDILLSLFKKMNKQDSVFHYLSLCYALRDSVTKKENLKQIQALHIYEQLRQQSLEEARLKYRNTTTYTILFVIIGAFILFSIAQYRNLRHKQKAKSEIEKTYSKLAKTHETLKSTQTQLIQKEKLASLGELTAGIAHEIQNPLNFVNNFSELSVDLVKDLKEEIEKPDIDKEYVSELFTDLTSNQEKINHHGKRASNIVKGMLEHSRLSTGVKEPTDINKLVDESLRLSYHAMRAKDKNFNADYTMELDEAIGKINIIPQDMGRVLINLFNNAFYAVHQRNLRGFIPSTRDEGLKSDYTPSVTVSTFKKDNFIEIHVKDNGNGIPENIKSKIFQPFFTTKPTGEGTGLGLSLSYDIVVKGHGGSLEVASTIREDSFGEGVGSEFIIELPFRTNG